MSQVIIFIIFFTSVIFQTSFFPNITPFRFAPDIVLILIIFWSARSGFDTTWRWAVFFGLMLDVIYYQPIGINIITLSIVSFLSSSLAKRFLVTQTGLRFIITASFVFAGTIGYQLLISFLINIKEGQNIFYSLYHLINEGILLKIIYNLILFAVLYVPLKKIEKIIAFYDMKAKFAR